uniref:Putative secreted protein n=1 Tax=Panstrongylus lignarius TaxID=156445 RepID=A0A224Y4C5_9HEMI
MNTAGVLLISNVFLFLNKLSASFNSATMLFLSEESRRSLRTQSAGAGAGWTKLDGAGGGTGISPPGPTLPLPDAALLSRSS